MMSKERNRFFVTKSFLKKYLSIIRSKGKKIYFLRIEKLVLRILKNNILIVAGFL